MFVDVVDVVVFEGDNFEVLFRFGIVVYEIGVYVKVWEVFERGVGVELSGMSWCVIMMKWFEKVKMVEMKVRDGGEDVLLYVNDECFKWVWY